MIGSRLRELRGASELSLRELGAATGLSATLLSQIERGVTEPSLKTLRLLADHFGQSISTLFQESGLDQAHVTRPGERPWLTSPRGAVQYERLTYGNGQLEVLRGVLDPGEASSEEPRCHEAVECAYVLAGQLTVEQAGRRYLVESGEALTMKSSLPHRYLNRGTVPAEFIVSVTPPTP